MPLMRIRNRPITVVGTNATPSAARLLVSDLASTQAPLHAYPSWYHSARDAFEERFRAYLASTFGRSALKQPVLDAVVVGRRVRPTLYFALWHDQRRVFPAGMDLLPAVAVELFHSASIVVDDILDGELRRRNKVPLFRRHGIQVAILVSHELVARAYECLHRHPRARRLVKLATSCYSRAIAGEAYDLGLPPMVPVAEQYKRALPKTSAIFAFIGQSLKVGLPSSGPDIPRLLSLVGEAFQLSNDTIDLMFIAESRRHDPRLRYPLRPSYALGILVEAGLVDPNDMGKLLPYGEHCEIANKAHRLIGDPQAFLEMQIRRILQLAENLSVPRSSIHLLDEFLEGATKPSFWLHHHE